MWILSNTFFVWELRIPESAWCRSGPRKGQLVPTFLVHGLLVLSLTSKIQKSGTDISTRTIRGYSPRVGQRHFTLEATSSSACDMGTIITHMKIPQDGRKYPERENVPQNLCSQRESARCAETQRNLFASTTQNVTHQKTTLTSNTRNRLLSTTITIAIRSLYCWWSIVKEPLNRRAVLKLKSGVFSTRVT